MLLEIISKLEEMKEGWQDTAQECEDFRDTTGAAYSRGVVAGINNSIEKIKKMLDDEVNKMAPVSKPAVGKSFQLANEKS